MGTTTGIEWTDRTWNPVTGCSKVSQGCKHCYAETLSLRQGWSQLPWTPANAAQNVILHPERLDYPLRWRQPKRIFVNSMSDLFHELVPDAFIDAVFAVMALAGQHIFQVLTKRPERMRDWLCAASLDRCLAEITSQPYLPHDLLARSLRIKGGHANVSKWPLPNVWLGTSVENQHWADVRVPLLLDTPAAVRFLSCEPLLGPVDLTSWIGPYDCMACGYVGAECVTPAEEDTLADLRCPTCGAEEEFGFLVNHPAYDKRLHWVIVGGESGPDHRPIQPAWVTDLRDQCGGAEVAFFFKQWGGRTPKAGGRLLDGREWSEFPTPRPLPYQERPYDRLITVAQGVAA